MNTKRVNSAADVILRALTQNRTAAGIACALESAQMLQSPETAAESAKLRQDYVEAAATVARLVQERGERMKVENALRDEAEELRARVAELEAAAKEIQRLHTDSPMGPCPVCIDGDAMVRGDDYTLPYPCPTARLAGAKDCDPPSQRQASHLPAEGGDAR
jgi:hypothetical protein